MRVIIPIFCVVALLPVGRALAAPASPLTVALTFDDLPFASSSGEDRHIDATEALQASKSIQKALRRHSAPAIGFVTESEVQKLGRAGVSILKSWNRDDFELGNHGFAHLDSNTLTIDQVKEEIRKGERTIKPMVKASGRRLRFFRFPFNHVGDSQEKRGEIEELLGLRGYRLAASTIDTSDYVFARAYDRAAARRNAAARKRIEEVYLDYTREQIGYYASLNARVLGYEPPEILLLHLNRLNATVMESILKIFESLNYKFITLEQAQSDPAYLRSPAVATKYGPMWGYRWAGERAVKVDGSLEKEPPAWIERFADGK